MKRVLKWGGIALGVILIVALAAGLWFRSRVTASLPQIEGEILLSGLGERVEVGFDSLGVPRVRGASRIDVARATGYLHAQNRFFQMDLLRRRAAGELAEVLGSALLRADRAVRPHRFRDVARRVISASGPADRARVEAYTEGVNTGLAALGDLPFEYLLLSSEPVAWTSEDSVLVILAMFLDLNDSDGSRESALGVMRDVLPQELFEFLAPAGSDWDAPIVGEALSISPFPGPHIFDLRTRPVSASARQVKAVPGDPEEMIFFAGSNNWAVGGELTEAGSALLANDMHLALSVPNIWYRASLEFEDNAGEVITVTGATLPGVPTVIAGSNGHVAWGFTNSQGDWGDLVVIEPDPDDPEKYLTPEGARAFTRHQEVIRINGGEEETLEVLWTIWGPVIDEDHKGRRRAMRWVAHDVEGVNFAMSAIEQAHTIEEIQAAGARSGTPPQNLVAVDRTGRVGWTIMGAIPKRFGFDSVTDARLPSSWADGTRGWDGWIAPEDYPKVIFPADRRIWTANARVVDGEMLRVIGDGGYALGARAAQIRDDLHSIEKATPENLLVVQLDDRGHFLQRWRGLLLDVLDSGEASGNQVYAEVRKHAESWEGRASVESVGYRIIRAFRIYTARQVFESLTADCRKADEDFQYFEVSQYEGPLWQLVTNQPLHMLDPKFETWNEQLLAAVDETVKTLTSNGAVLSEQTWGRRNTTRIKHPISWGVPLLSRWLDMRSQPLPGDSNMPRVQTPSAGASQRMVVSPGREEEGIFHMPGGQSGHPFSPWYAAGHQDWEAGVPASFLPGPAEHTLVFEPPK